MYSIYFNHFVIFYDQINDTQIIIYLGNLMYNDEFSNVNKLFFT